MTERACGVLIISMRERETWSLEQIRAFVEGSEEIRFEGQKRKEIYRWVEKTLVEQRDHSSGKAGKGLLRRYLEKMTGLSRAQVTRLISR